MNLKDISAEKIAIVVLVFIISVIVGWYGERAVEKFMADIKTNSVQSL